MRSIHLKPLACVALVIVFLTFCGVEAFGSDQQRAKKRLRRTSAMAFNSMSRSIVNQTMADVLHAKRIELMRQRHAMNLSYGALFLAHQLTAAGAQMLDIAVQLESGKDIFQIANERNADWKLITDAVKHLNEKIDDNIYRHFLHQTTDQPPAAVDKYDSDKDIVRADLDVTPEELASAQVDYALWKNRGLPPGGGRLDRQTEKEASQSAEIYKGVERPHPVP